VTGTPTIEQMVDDMPLEYSNGTLARIIRTREIDIAQQIIDTLVNAEGWTLDSAFALLRGAHMTVPDLGPGIDAAEMIVEMSHRLKILVSDLESVADKIQGSTPF